MRTDDDLRDAMRMSAAPTAGSEAARTIDTDAVLARSRRRRLPKQFALGGAVGLVVVGLGVAGFSGITSVQTSTTAEYAGDAAEAPAAAQPEPGEIESGSAAGGISRAPAEKVNACGGTLAEVAPNESGLSLEPVFTAGTPGATVEGVVRLTNSGTERVVGTTPAAPAVTVSQGGLVLWHSTVTTNADTVSVDLAPGESLEYDAEFDAVRCEVEDDTRESFRPDLPPLPPGSYELSALIDFTPSGADAVPVLVGGPTSAIAVE